MVKLEAVRLKAVATMAEAQDAAKKAAAAGVGIDLGVREISATDELRIVPVVFAQTLYGEAK